MFKTTTTLAALISLCYGAAYTLMPGFVNGLYMDANPQSILTGRFFGLSLLFIGFACWFLRDATDASTQRGLSIAGLVNGAVGFVTSLVFTLNGGLSFFGWSAAVIYLVLGVMWLLSLRKASATLAEQLPAT